MIHATREELNKWILRAARAEYELLHAPLKFRVSGDRYILMYRGWTFSQPEPFTEKQVSNIILFVDYRTEQQISKFTDPIFRQVFGLE